MAVPKSPVLLITNRECAADEIRRSGVSGEVLPRRNVLHRRSHLRGPLPRCAQTLLWGRGELDRVVEDFARPRRGAGSFRDHEEVVLLLEHDLYDRRRHRGAALGCYHHQPPVKISSGRKAPTTQLGASTTSWMRRSTATLHKVYASSRERPCLSTSCSIVARTAPLVASIRSGATPVETWYPVPSARGSAPGGTWYLGVSMRKSRRTERRKETSIAVSMAVPQTSPSPCAEWVSPTEKSAPSTPTGR